MGHAHLSPAWLSLWWRYVCFRNLPVMQVSWRAPNEQLQSYLVGAPWSHATGPTLRPCRISLWFFSDDLISCLEGLDAIIDASHNRKFPSIFCFFALISCFSREPNFENINLKPFWIFYLRDSFQVLSNSTIIALPNSVLRLRLLHNADVSNIQYVRILSAAASATAQKISLFQTLI